MSTNAESSHTVTPIQCFIPKELLNKYGGYEPKATEFELAVTCPSSSHSNFEVWDQENE